MPASRLALYTRSVSAVGAVIFVYSLFDLAITPKPVQWLLFSALVLLSGRFTTSIASIEASISVSDTFFIAAALLFGPGPAMITLAADSFVLSMRKRHDWNRITFNTFAPALSLWVAAHAFFALLLIPPLAAVDAPVGPLLIPLLILAIIYFGLNSGLTAVAVGLESRQPVEKIWRQHLAMLSLSYFAAASTALCLVLIIRQVGLLAVPIILPVLAEFHLTLRTSFGRLQDAERHVTQMDLLYVSTVETLAMAIDAKDTVTHSHVRRVQALATTLAHALHVSDAPTLRALETAALLHDTGKLAVPERILNKPGKLTSAEFDQMKRHVDVGADILSLVPFPFPVVPIVRCHHENWDGTGYPRGVAGPDIPIGARILSVVDCYDALTSDRPYRKRLTDEAALAIVRDRRGSMYDPLVVDAFVAIDVNVRQAEAPTDGRAHVLDQLRASAPPPPLPQPVAAAVADVPRSDPLPAANVSPDAADPDLADFIRRVELANGSGTLHDLLRLSNRLVQEIAPDATGAWFIPDLAGGHLRATEPFGSDASILTGRSIAVGEKLTGWVAVHRQVIMNSDAALDLDESARSTTPVLARCLSVPVADGDALAGVLTLYAGERHPFTEEQGHRLEQVAPHVAKAIHLTAA